MSSDYERVHTELCERTIENNNNIVETLLTNELDEHDGVWIFGYGSLMWKTNFEYSEKCVGYIKGYSRRFWQASVDHRGTITMPGRVATLIPASQDQIVYGVGYHIPNDIARETLRALTKREKHGFTLKVVNFTPMPNNSSPLKALLYVASSDNEGFVRNESLEEISQRISKSIGPSGTNKEYLYNVAETLLAYKATTEDDINHTIKLYKLVKSILQE